MEILNVPFEWLIGFVFLLTALYVLLRGMRLPADFSEKEKARAELKRKVREMEQIEAELFPAESPKAKAPSQPESTGKK